MWQWNPSRFELVIPFTISANTQLHHRNSLHWLILKQRQGQKIVPHPPPTDSPPLPYSHQHHHFHHYMKYDRERNPTMPCKCRRELASRRHKRSACIIWPGEHHLWGDSQRLRGGKRGGVEGGGGEEEREDERGNGSRTTDGNWVESEKRMKCNIGEVGKWWNEQGGHHRREEIIPRQSEEMEA